jgi:DNA-binding MarR family transcriptional regulator
VAERKLARHGKSGDKLARIGGLALGDPLDQRDKLLHDRVRLGIVSALAVNPALSFRELKELLELSDGNLSVHARKLEEAGLLACEKGYDGRVPRTDFSLTAAGRRALERHLDHMERLIRAVRRR